MNDDKAFLDTNVFIYMYDVSQPDRKEASLLLLVSNDCITSTQAINEISNVLLRKLKKPFLEVLQVLEDIYLVCEVKLLQKATVFHAIGLMERYEYSYYDCLMLASALENNCNILYSEDMQDKQIIENRLKIINPYKTLKGRF